MNGSTVKFLLVDDTEENLVALSALLRRDGLELFEARSGSEALELLLVHDFALAFIDVQMPGMNGFQLAELMRGTERTKQVPIIFVTAGAHDASRVFKGYESGGVDFLFKPIEPAILKGKADVFFELSRQRNELAGALWLNEMFVGILGHDLRNPLAAMMAGLSLLARQNANEASRPSLQRMLGAGQRMNEMIEQLLDLTRARLADGLGFARERKPVELGTLMRRTIDELRVAHPGREITVNIAGDVPLLGDSGRLLQLFSNLLGNALSHGAEGTVVTIVVEQTDAEVHARVHNRGVIPPDLLPLLFDPFRLRKGRPRGPGLGLGLFISQQIAKAHGGEVTVRSSEDSGTEFNVRLPKQSAAPVTPRDIAKTTKKVLIVDDDADVREALRDAFEGAGYSAILASNGLEAMELFKQQLRPDLVILDVGMPVLDGTQVYSAMQSDAALAAIPVIFSTSTPSLAPPGAIVVPKPLRLDRLLATMKALLRA